MGRIVSLRLRNFKSYGGEEEVIGPFGDFSAVIGPNGAGKSNLMDGISFVLGVQSRALRSTQLKDLLHNNNKASSSTSEAGGCSVHLEYQLDGKEQQFFPEVTSDQLIFSRLISPNGVGRYLLNNAEVSFSEYEDTLKKLGIFIKARNFLVFQGDVEAIASKNPTELTTLFENISSSGDLKKQYDELLQLKNDSEENTIFAYQKKKGLIAERKNIMQQKKEAEKYQERVASKKELALRYSLWQLHQIEQVTKFHESQLQERQAQLDKEQEKYQKKEETLVKQLKKKMAQHRRKINEQRAELLTVKETLRKDVVPTLTQLQKETAQYTKNQTLGEKQATSSETLIKEQDDIINSMKDDMIQLQTAMKEFDGNDDNSEELVELEGSILEEYYRIKEEAQTQNHRLQVKYDTKQRERETKVMRRQQQHELIAQKKSELESVVQDISEAEKRCGKMQSVIQTTQQDITQAKQDEKQRQQQHNLLVAEREKLKKEYNEVVDSLRSYRVDRRANAAESRQKEMLRSLQSHFSPQCILGRLLDLVKPKQRKYNLALTLASGRNMDAIVVTTSEVAQQAIEFLRQKQLGSCLFLPVEQLQQKPIVERLRNLGTGMSLAIDLVQFDKQITPAISYALQDTIICNTIQQARDLCFRRGERVKAVTLDGMVVSKSGSMTGGRSGNNPNQRSDRWDESKVEELNTRREQIQQKLSHVESQFYQSSNSAQNSTATTIEGLENRIRYAKADLKTTESKIKQYKQQRKLISQEIETLNEEGENEKKEDEEEKEMNKLKKTMEGLEEKLFADFSARVLSTKGVNIRTYEKEIVAKSEAKRQKQSQIRSTLSKLEAQLAYEQRKKNDAQGKLKKMVANLKQQQEKQKKEVIPQERQYKEKEERMRKQIESLTQQLKEEEEELETEENEMHKVKKDLKKQSQTLVQFKEKTTALQDQLDQAKELKTSILLKAEREQIRIPLVDQMEEEQLEEDDSNLMDVDESFSLQATNDSESQFSEEIVEKRVLSKYEDNAIDYSILDEEQLSTCHNLSLSDMERSSDSSDEEEEQKVDAVKNKKKTKRKTKKKNSQKMGTKIISVDKILDPNICKDYESELHKLSIECEKMQPNLKALEKYEEIRQRIEEEELELDRIKVKSTEAAQSFETVKRARYERFMESFNHVSGVIDAVYKKLTQSTKHALGGTAYLALENREEPYLFGMKYNAMPPMKRFREMEQLSGGEKTVAALALLFAVHSFRPCPFFVLDEVDAALDNVNVQKICHFIKQQTKQKNNSLQCIVISLKDSFYEKADSLIGVCKDIATQQSHTLTLDLTKYDTEEQQQDEEEEEEVENESAEEVNDDEEGMELDD